MAEIGADGVNGDTQDGVPLTFSLAADKTGHPLAFEPEGSPADEALAWNVMTWVNTSFLSLLSSTDSSGFPQAYQLTEHGKLLLMSPSMDRSAAIGFRCVGDAPEPLYRGVIL
jgi:hypothetical protein